MFVFRNSYIDYYDYIDVSGWNIYGTTVFNKLWIQEG